MVLQSRRVTAVLARTLVLLLVLGSSVLAATHGDADDDPCDGPLTAAAASLHAAGSPIKVQHCDVCHWLRSLRTFDAAVGAPVFVVEREDIGTQAVDGRVASRRVHLVASRAPPA